MSAPLLLAGAVLAAAVVYRPPVDAPVADRFRPPATPYGRGNRGLAYAAPPGAAVRAAGPGVVGFSGLVAGRWHVSIVHPDGLRTTYSSLRAVHVHRGDRVQDGRVIGTADDGFHLGALAGDAYLDPEQLFGTSKGRARLVPDAEETP